MKQINNNNFLLICIIIGAILHIVSAFFTIGFYSDDEHFQILEIAAYLLSINNVAIEDTSGYYWEWREHIRMRPWIQPYLYFNFINFLKLLGINDPFLWTLYIRLLSSLLGFLSIIYLYFTLRDKFFVKNYKFNTFIFFSFWFYPFLHSRTSSENLGITLFIISFCLIYNLLISKKINFSIYKFITAAFFFGMSMVVKFTLVFTTIPVYLWLCVFRFKINLLLILTILIFISLGIGILIDSLFWGYFTNTYYQFYIFNLSDELGRLNDFGIEPWYFYITETSKQLAPPISVFFLIGLIFYWYHNKLDIISWLTMITLLVFSIIGHKEIRYFFPIYLFAPFLLAYFFNFISNIYLLHSIKSIVVISNLIFLILTLFVPPNTKVGVYKYIFDNLNDSDKIYYSDENPYLINNMEPFFYTNFINKIEPLNKNISNNYWVVSNNYESLKKLNITKCDKMYSTYPDFIFKINKNWKRLKLNWYIYYCS